MVKIDTLNLRLQNLGFCKFTPSIQLQNYIQCFWIIARKDKLHSPIINRVAPDGGVGIIFNFGSSFYCSNQNESYDCNDRSIITGTTRNSVKMCFNGEINALGIRFHPGGAYPFIQIPIHELTDHVISLNDIDIQISETHFSIIANATKPEHKISLLQNLLLSRLVDFNYKEPLLFRSIALIQKHEGLIKVEEIAKRLGMSRRNCERKFKTYVGLTPKMFSRIVRIQAARLRIKTKNDSSLTEVGYETGFYDQAHFIREFKSIMNLTPKEYLLEKRGMSHLYNS